MIGRGLNHHPDAVTWHVYGRFVSLGASWQAPLKSGRILAEKTIFGQGPAHNLQRLASAKTADPKRC